MTEPATKSAPRLGAKIRRLRRQQGMSQAQLAANLAISASYLNLIEHNRRKYPADVVRGSARKYDEYL